MIKGLMRIGTFYLIGVDQFFVDSLKSIKNLTFKNSSVCPFLMLEPDPFAFLRNKKRKRIERAIEEGKGQFSVKIYKGQSEELLKILQKVEYKSPKRSSYKDSLSDTYLDDLLLSLNRLNKNHLLTIVLYFKEEPVGFQYGFLYRGVFHGGNMAYKAEFADFVPGRVLVYLMLPELLKMGIKMVDFSRGDSQFKREFTPNFYTQYSISYSPDFLLRFWWKLIEGAFNYLEAHPKLFEIARIGKNIFVRKFVNEIKGNILISKEKITLASGKVEKI